MKSDITIRPPHTKRNGPSPLDRGRRQRAFLAALALAVASVAFMACSFLESNERVCYSWDGSGRCLEYTESGSTPIGNARPTATAVQSQVSAPTATPRPAPTATPEVEPTATTTPPQPTVATVDPTATPGATPAATLDIQPTPTTTPIEPSYATFQLTRLTGDQTHYAYPTWSPDGTKIAFSLRGQGDRDWEIFVMDTHGPSVTPLTDRQYSSFTPAWSPNGSLVSFSYENSRGGQRVILVVDADGNNETLVSETQALNPHDPHWSPDGTKIAFSSDRNRDGVWDIFVMDANGFNITSFPHGGAAAAEPAWSPNGTRIAFSSDRLGDGIWDIFVMDTDGSNVTRITDHHAQARYPRWAPDGSKIIFHSNRDGTDDIYVVNPDGSEPTQITRTEGVSNARTPDWAPDGTTIVFVSESNGRSDLFLANVESLGITPNITVPKSGQSFKSTQITHIEGILRFPVWSPDGTRIAFDSDIGGTFNLYVVNPDGSELTRITHHEGDGSARVPQWSPDGTRIAFFSDSDGTFDIYVIKPDGTDLTQITRTEGDSGAWYPVWSPDGTRIAFHSNRDGTFDIFVVNPDGTGLTQITRTEGDTGAMAPQWSPDGTRIVFSSGQDGKSAISIANSDGSGLTQITDAEEFEFALTPQWSPDGTRIAFEAYRADGETRDIHVVNPDGSDLNSVSHNEQGVSAEFAQWSPDGTRVTFQSDRDGTFDVYVANADGSELTQITRTEGDSGALNPRWSPGGTRIVFGNLVGDLYVVNVESLSIGAAQTFTQPTDTQESAVLTAIYEATNGDGWNDNNGWLSSNPLDQWKGVSIQGGRVIGLDLSANGLMGVIPDAIGELTELRHLNLSDNSLAGQLPESLGNLQKLETLMLSENDLAGCVPVTLRNAKVSDIIFTSIPFCDEGPKQMPASPASVEWSIGETVRESEERAARLGVQWLHQYAQQNGWPTIGDNLTIDVDATEPLVNTCKIRFMDVPAIAPLCDDIRREDKGGLSPSYVSDAPEANFVNTTEPGEKLSLDKLHEIARNAIQHNIQTSFQHQARGFSADPSPVWFTEGMATYFAAVIADQHLSAHQPDGPGLFEEQRNQWVEVAKRETDNPLLSSETESNCEYECGPLAIELLVSIAGVERLSYFHLALSRTILEAFSGTVPEGVIHWQGSPNAWRAPFTEIFGMTVPYFYALYDQHRVDRFPKLDPPDTAP